jgi:K+-transporting ATPase ATPase A chain
MTFNGWFQIALYCAVVIAAREAVRRYMTRVFSGERTCCRPCSAGRARLLSLGGVDERASRTGSLCRVACCCSAWRLPAALCADALPGVLPFNPAGQSAVEEGLAFNTAMSFTPTPTGSPYVPETTMSYLVQMAGLTVHNFVSAATGHRARVRPGARLRAPLGQRHRQLLGRSHPLHALHPAAASIVVGLFFVWQGMPQNLGAYTEATTLEGAKQVIAQGPVASQEVIKMLGTNGGGFFNTNSAHPFENPTPITNFVRWC